MSSLIEQRKAYANALQELIDERKASLEAKVAAYRAQLEREATVTPEMQRLSNFIRSLDEMIAFEAEHQKDAACVVNGVDESSETFCDNAESADNTVEQTAETESAGLEGTPFEALATDAADTRERLKAVEQGRPGMPNVVLPHRQ